VTHSFPAGVRPSPRIGPAESVCSRKDFGRLRREGARGGDAVIRVLVAKNGLEWSRIASAVSRRYGKAVARNVMRRRYREAFRQAKGSIPLGLDIVVSPARGSGAASLEAVKAALIQCVPKVARRLEKKKKKN
jgi:ribonuclease P protein component